MQATASSTPSQAAKIPPDQLDSLVAPIALYPDPLLAQTLAASTYPLEIVQLQQWLEKHKGSRTKRSADAVAKAVLGSERPGDGRLARRGQATGRRHPVDDRPGQRVSGAAKRRNGCRAAHAQESPGQGQFEIDRATEGGNKSRRKQDGDRRRTGQPQVVYVPSYNPVVVYGPPIYPILRFITRPVDTTLRAWPSRSAWV